MTKIKLELGVQAEDKITGFKGIVVGKSEWITGCDQYVLKPRVNEKGEEMEGKWFDEGRLIVTGPGINKEEVQDEENPGGPQSDAPIV